MNIEINTNDIMMALGYKNTSASPFILKQANAVAIKANKLASYNSISKKIGIAAIKNDDIILDNGDRFTCKSMAKGLKGCTYIMITVVTMGHKIDNAIHNAFSADDALLAMMLDAAGSRAVSHYTNALWNTLVDKQESNMGITRGYSPGSKDFPIEQQQIIFKNIDAKSIDVSLNDSFLMMPAKSISVVYGMGKDIAQNCASHSCKGCTRVDCLMRDDREVEIKVHINDKKRNINAPIGASLMALLKDNDVPIEFLCNGRGTCGSCAVRFTKSIPETSDNDIKILSKRQLADGWRLTCDVIVSHPLELYVHHSKMQILADEKSDDTEVYSYAIAIDIGTTTIVCHLIDGDDGNILDTEGAVNKQRKFGADVASRILHEMQHPDGKKQMNDAIIGQLNKMIKNLLNRNPKAQISHVVAVGNTVMTHILSGYAISSLGSSPYTPVSLDRLITPCNDLGIDLNCNITVMEGFDSYVGSDITVGTAVCNLMESDDYTILIDLGTNGEIALGNRNNLYCCATAAGPAFEAVNIHNGMSGLPGAVSAFSYDNGAFAYKTIDDKQPLGICGSGVLDITAVLLEQGIVDMTGRMLGDHPMVKFNDKVKEYISIAQGKNDEIIFTAKDMREIQLAKAAIAAGINTLLETAKISYDVVKEVFIAGGFGNYMDIKSALKIGLIPKELTGKITASGNTAARGAVAAHDKAFLNKVAIYVEKVTHIELATSMIFQNHYIECMGF